MTAPQRGQQYVAYGDRRPAERVFIQVTRVARDGSWVDIRCCTWAVMWTKRMRVWPPDGAQLRHWDQGDLNEQEDDHMAKLRERGAIL